MFHPCIWIIELHVLNKRAHFFFKSPPTSASSSCILTYHTLSHHMDTVCHFLHPCACKCLLAVIWKHESVIHKALKLSLLVQCLSIPRHYFLLMVPICTYTLVIKLTDLGCAQNQLFHVCIILFIVWLNLAWLCVYWLHKGTSQNAQTGQVLFTGMLLLCFHWHGGELLSTWNILECSILCALILLEFPSYLPLLK